METTTETNLNNFYRTGVRPGVEDVKGDVKLFCELGTGFLAQQTLQHMFGFDSGLAQPEEGLRVLHGGGEPGDEDDRVAEPRL